MNYEIELFLGAAAAVVACLGNRDRRQAAVSGDYVEIRSCDVYTGSCFANAEMGLEGKDAIMTWSIRKGEVDGVNLDGLKVVAVVRASGTLGDVVAVSTGRPLGADYRQVRHFQTARRPGSLCEKQGRQGAGRHREALRRPRSRSMCAWPVARRKAAPK